MPENNDTTSRSLALLAEVQTTILGRSDITDSFHAALEILTDSNDMLSAAILMADDNEPLLRVAASVGYQTDVRNIAYEIDDGLTGQIFHSGKRIVLPRVSQEPMFRNFLRSWIPEKNHEQSFIGVPLSHDSSVYGVLIVNLPYNAEREYASMLHLLTIIATTLAQAVYTRKAVAAERERLQDENVLLRQKLQGEYGFHNIIGNSHQMRDVYAKVARVSGTNTTVLIRGESGTGKELIAEAVHYNSPRKNKPFIRVNCAAVPETLIESEFFGYEKGAFTGAFARKPGRFELADGGTIFLDEIAELSPMTQVKLLRVLQEQTFERIGGTDTVKVDVRVITATNSDLEELIQKDTFREDLYYRLNIFSIYLPPLRERKTDVLLLADHFMLKYSRRHAKAVKRISTPAIDMLMRYHWPGNVRELENCIERAVLLCEDQVIHSYNLPPTLQTAESSNTVPKMSLKDAVTSYEKELIQDALKSSRGNRAKAARLLNTTERILNYKITNHEIDVARFKP